MPRNGRIFKASCHVLPGARCGGGERSILAWFGHRTLETISLLRSQTARDAVLVAVAQLVSAVLRFSVTVFMARLLSPADWGNVAVFIAMVDVFAILGDGGVNATLVRFIAADARARASAVFCKCASLKALICVTLLGILWVLREPILENQRFPDELHWLYPVAMCAAVFVTFHGLMLSVFQAKQEYGRYALGYVAVNTLRVFAFAMLMILGISSLRGITLAFFSMPAVALLLAAPLAFHTLWRRSSAFGPTARISTLLLFMGPVAAINAIMIGNMRISNFMLKALASSEAVANYELACQLGFVFPLLSGALFTVLLPKVSAMQSREELRNYRARLLRIYPAVLPVCLAGVLIGPWFIALVFGAKYVDSLMIVRVLVIAFGIQVLSHPLGLVFYAVSRPGYLTLVHFLQFVVIVTLNWIFIPLWGGVGAAIAMLIAASVTVAAVIAGSGWVIRVREREAL